MVLRLIDQQLESRQAACIYVRNELADVAQDIERENVACIMIGRCLDLDAEPVKIAVAPTCDIPENETRTIAMNGKLVLVARTIADARAIENRCSHALQALEGRKLRGGISSALHTAHAFYAPASLPDRSAADDKGTRQP